QPVLSAAGTTRNLTVQSGVILNLQSSALNVNGDLSAPSATSFISSGGALNLLGSGRTLGGTLGSALPVNVSGSYTLTGRTVVGNLSVTGATGSLTVGGQTLAITGNLSTTGSGVITMTNVLDSVIVTGNATFGGGSESGLLTAGVLSVGGSFSQLAGGSAARFEASGTHRTVLTGASTTVNIQTSGNTPGTSHFQELTWAGGGTMNLGTLTYVLGQMTVNAAGTISGVTFTQSLHVGNLANTGVLTFLNAQPWIETNAPVPVALSNLTFTVSGVNALYIRHPGLPAGGKLTIDNVTFTNVPSPPFTYIDVGDTNPLDGNLVVVDVTNSSPAASTLVTLANGATVNWPPVAPVATWNGTNDNNWDNPLNWSTGAVPGPSDDVIVPANTPNDPVAGSISTRDLTVQAGATLTAGDHTFNVAGDLDAAGTIGGAGACCNVYMTGVGVTARGNLDGFSLDVAAGAVVTLNGRVTMSGGASVNIAGTLILGGHTLAAVGISTTGAGVLTMTNTLDSLLVSGSANFDGGSTAGTLTAGVILMNTATGATFSQGRTVSDASFAPTGSHKVVLAAAGSIDLSMMSANIGSHFNILDISAQAAGLSISSAIQVNGLFISTPGASPPVINGGDNRLSVGGGTQVTGLTLDNTPLIINGGTSFQFDNVRLQNMSGSASQISGSLPGFATPLVFNGLVFSGPPPTTGFYVDLADSDNPSPDTLVVNLVNPTPANPGTFARGTNGAVINWPAASPAITWTGALNNDWSNPGNWSGGVRPTASDNVIVGPTAIPPVLTQNEVVASLTVQFTASLDLGPFSLVVVGDMNNLGTVTATPGVGGLSLAGTGASTLRGSFNTLVVVTGTYSLIGRTTAQHLMVIGASGDLNLSGQTLAV
ncbi:MAG: hypothetical protein OEV95_13240, partial [Gemmatimonadota bacterium]|nr:hypothetical protein [Gemmatimonadota bacterium]